MKMITTGLLSAMVAASLMGCQNNTSNNVKPGITKAEWGEADGKKVYLFTLVNNKGTEVKISNYGGIVTSFITEDKNGKPSNIVVGFDSLASYLQKPPYFGALIGRYGNRIGDAAFTLNGTAYTLAANNGKNHLHGGLKGFDKVVWDATVVNDSLPQLTLAYVSKDGEEGYPGNLKVLVQYSLTDNNELKIEYNAETDKATPLNLTNHSYFNLSGDVSSTILNHSLQIDADRYTPVDTTLIPTGELKPVKGTPFDFTTAQRIGSRIDSVPGGYDHNWVLNRKDSSSIQLVATLRDSLSGRKLEVFTTQPGLQFYSGNFLDGKFVNRDGKTLLIHTALCLETQHYPDSPNKPGFPSTILQPGQQYHQVTLYKISVTQ